MLGVLIVLIIFAAGFGTEVLFKRFTANFRKKLSSIPTMDGFLKFWSAVLKFLPDLLGIIIFVIASLFLFWLCFGATGQTVHLLFVEFLVAIIIIRLVSAISRMMCEPSLAKLRIIPLSDQVSLYLHRNIVLLTWIIILGLMLCGLLYRMKISFDSYITLMVATGTVVIFMIAGMVLKNRIPVAQAILGADTEDCEGRSWLQEQFAAIWHILALSYLLLIWVLGTGRLITVGPQFDGAFIISMLIVPIYLVIDRAAQWLILATAGTIHAYKAKTTSEETDKKENDTKNQKEPDSTMDIEAKEDRREERYIFMAKRIVRIFIVFSLAFWLLGIWGIGIPFGRSLLKSGFNIMVTLALAHIAWGFVMKLVNRKLQESRPVEEESDSDGESEWGGKVLDRSQTILPLLRKFIGSVLAVMVIMIILSSIGVDIGPLLAGAGVIGIAIGFGAQKLVSDVLSGLFFLIDDSFRIGEYLMAGSISGSVEKITLRNLWLRHHRGMLQIVPFGNLGTVTNYMRGGMVVKFNLQFSYDTDIDKVRKIIKKVGKSMLEDEEFGSNFIKQVKSQGVRDVSDSVMTIRVKFTAKPGTHFLIRREAYKRITEALAKKGIFYAHRKVIVDLAQPKPSHEQISEVPPDDTKRKPEASTDINGPIKAGAAAALEIIRDEQQKEEK
jgi:small-conductance mechanosensitive channel